MNEEAPQLIVVYGRRRVGKTYLINQYFEGRFDFKLTGTFNADQKDHLRDFSDELSRQTGEEKTCPNDWKQAFNMLRSYLMALPKEEKHVVFFDEMPWLDTPRSNFLKAFEHFWNDFGCAFNNLVFIVCGSATSWIQKKIAENKGGLFHRQTCTLYLRPFSLYETDKYLKSRNMEWDFYDVAQIYMILGGIPFYLSLLRSDMSPGENIDNLFFRKRAELWDEFDHLYNTLFSNSKQYIRLVEILGEKRGGMTRNELSTEPDINDNGRLSGMLSDLVASDFVRMSTCFGKKKQEIRYQLSDYYTLFYFRFLKGKQGVDEHYWSKTYDDPARRAWAGLSFEQLCKDHVTQIKSKLGILGVLSEESVWSVKKDPGKGIEKGAQIDMIIDRADHVINICEIKYSTEEYEIDADYSLSLKNKVEAFRKATDTKKTLSIAMITTYGVKQNKYSNLVNNQILLSDLFRECSE
jgi:AAA+ ATPase superfamily predicted ATPase